MGHGERVRLEGLSKRYGDVTAVEAMDLTIEAGEFVTLLGPSGSGKSTTLAMIAGFEDPSEGRIRLGDRDITNTPTHRRGLGMVFQGYALFPHMSVFENVAFGLKLQHVRGAELSRKVREVLEVVDLPGMERRRPAELSGGQQQRVALARAIVQGPSLLLMDEPLSALDKSLRKQMQTELRRIHRELGTTVLYVTHDQEEALGLSDRIVVMHDGGIAQVGTPREIYEAPASRFVAQAVGDANFLQMSDTGTVMFRPEDAHLDKPEDEHTCLDLTIEELLYLGDRIRLVGALADGQRCVAWVHHSASSALTVGEQKSLYWPTDRTVVVA